MFLLLQSNFCHLYYHFFIQTCTVHVKKNKRTKQPPLLKPKANISPTRLPYASPPESFERWAQLSSDLLDLWAVFSPHFWSLSGLCRALAVVTSIRAFLHLSFFFLACSTFATSQTHIHKKNLLEALIKKKPHVYYRSSYLHLRFMCRVPHRPS